MPLAECLAFYEAGQYQDVLMAAEPALERVGAASPERGHEVAALWSLVGLARQALSDEEGARAAFEEAIRVAPEADRARYQSYLAALAAGVAQQLLARAEAFGEAGEDKRLAILKQAVLWLRQGSAAASDDESLKAALERARKGLWVAYSRMANILIERRELQGARRLLREALTEEELPRDRRDAFEELLSAIDQESRSARGPDAG